MIDSKTLFLREFTKELILHVPKTPVKKDNHFEKEFQELKVRMKEKMKDIESDIFPSNIQTKPIILETPKQQPVHFIPRQIPVIKPQKVQQPQQTVNTLEKLKGILADPKVIMLECPGPDKFILVKTATRVMTTGIKLSKEDISSITENFSKETKIPIIAGLFKAVKDNLMITAIISEVTGSRFILKKIGTI